MARMGPKSMLNWNRHGKKQLIFPNTYFVWLGACNMKRRGTISKSTGENASLLNLGQKYGWLYQK